LATATIPQDKALVGAFWDLTDAADAAVQAICADLAGRADLDPGSDEAKVARLYRSYLDEAGIAARGAAPLAPLLAQIEAIASLDDLRAWIGWCLARHLATVADWSIEPDPEDPTRYALFLAQAGLGLPDESYYREPRREPVRLQYRDHLARTLALAGGRDQPNDDDQRAGQAVFELETAIAAAHWDTVRTRDMTQLHNRRTLDQLVAEAPGFGWPALWSAWGLTGRVDTVVDCQPSFFAAVSRLFDPARLDAWRAWARYHLTCQLSPFLDSRFVEAWFSFHGQAVDGLQALRERPQRAAKYVNSALGDAIGQQYVARHYSPRAARRMADLVAHLVAAYRQAITDLAWMGPTTKTEALRKLDKLHTEIGHPATWRDYSGLAIGDDLVGNVLAVRQCAAAYDLGKLARAVDRGEWDDFYPQTVNAGYDPLRNSVVFPAVMLQPPFFDVEADDAVNYGSIGAMIGHEIGHVFDDQGSTCDADGQLRDWWTEQDKQAYRVIQQALIEQYDQLAPAQAPTVHVIGALTVGETIGDLGGLSIALRAWRRATGGAVEPIDGYTGQQRVFLAWAATWRSLFRTELLTRIMATDPHPPYEIRCNQVVRNIDDFTTAFGVTAADRMWLDPAQRVRIW
jgi:putative endopeptidase